MVYVPKLHLVLVAQDYFNGNRADVHQHSDEQFGQFHGQNTNSTADKKEVDLYRGISDISIVLTNPKRESETEDYNYRKARSKRKAGEPDESEEMPSGEPEESHFNLGDLDGHIRVRRSAGER
ncbi:hypothetical protein TNCV_3182421 [Trichonephila clavipes]|uniref:Uncharacterized protein n=1 Tax=Trichonephila clavipes TaxID=2585209 RepID=A0A8X6SHP8_TRICX|nr:hypothetical protein TNCV_3182421 [Trichonephila clavipes]